MSALPQDPGSAPNEPEPGPPPAEITVAEFAARLRELRRASRLSLSQLAALTHYNKASLSRAANGQRLPAWQLAEQYVRHCGGDVPAFEQLWQRVQPGKLTTTTTADTIDSPEEPTPPTAARSTGGGSDNFPGDQEPSTAVGVPDSLPGPDEPPPPHGAPTLPPVDEHPGAVNGQTPHAPRRGGPPARRFGSPLMRRLDSPLVRRGALLCIFLLLGVVLGRVIPTDGPGGVDTGSGEEVLAPPGPSASLTPGADVLVVMGPWNADNTAEMHMIQAVLQRFTEDEGILHAYMRPKHTQDFAEYYLGKQDRPDVTLMPQPALMRCAQARKQIQILPPEVAAVVGDYPDKSWTEKGKIGGGLYGVVFKSGNKSRVWYNRKLLARAGVTPASLQGWTWDQFRQKVTQLEDGLEPQQSALAVGAKQNEWVLTDWFENIYARVVGGDYEALVKRDPDAWKSPEVLKSLETMRELMGPQGKVEPFEMTRSQALQNLRNGTAAMIVGDFAKDLADEDTFGSVPFPADADPNKVIYGADIAVINRDSKNANELLKFLGTQTAADILADYGYSSPRTQPADPQADGVFDLSDQLPSEFGSRPQQGMQKILTDLVAKTDNPGTARDEPDTARDELASGVNASVSACPTAP